MMISSAINTSVQGGASHGLAFQTQPQTATHASGPQSFVIPGGAPLGSSASSGSLPKVGVATVQGVCDQIKGLSFNQNNSNSTQNNNQGSCPAQPANKENNTRKHLSLGGDSSNAVVQLTSQTHLTTNASRASSGGANGSMQLAYHHQKPGLMQSVGQQGPRGREFGREITNGGSTAIT